MLLAVSKPVLSNIVLRIGGNADIPLAIPVRPEPSPTNFPYMLPAEIVEKKP